MKRAKRKPSCGKKKITSKSNMNLKNLFSRIQIQKFTFSLIGFVVLFYFIERMKAEAKSPPAPPVTEAFQPINLNSVENERLQGASDPERSLTPESIVIDADDPLHDSIEGSLTNDEVSEASWLQDPYLSEDVLGEQWNKASSMARKGRRLMTDLSASQDEESIHFLQNGYHINMLLSVDVKEFIFEDEARFKQHIQNGLSEQPLQVSEDTFKAVRAWHLTYNYGRSLLNP